MTEERSDECPTKESVVTLARFFFLIYVGLNEK